MSYTIVYRSVKGSPLTNSEVDGNFQALDQNKANIDGSTPFTGTVTAPTFSGNLTGTVTSPGASAFTSQTYIGYNAAANAEVDFMFKTNNLLRHYTAVTGTNGQYLQQCIADDTGTSKGTVYVIDRQSGVLTFQTFPQITGSLALTDNSANVVTSSWVQGQGYITANGTAKYVTTITS